MGRTPTLRTTVIKINLIYLTAIVLAPSHFCRVFITRIRFGILNWKGSYRCPRFGRLFAPSVVLGDVDPTMRMSARLFHFVNLLVFRLGESLCVASTALGHPFLYTRIFICLQNCCFLLQECL